MNNPYKKTANPIDHFTDMDEGETTAALKGLATGAVVSPAASYLIAKLTGAQMNPGAYALSSVLGGAGGAYTGLLEHKAANFKDNINDHISALEQNPASRAGAYASGLAPVIGQKLYMGTHSPSETTPTHTAALVGGSIVGGVAGLLGLRGLSKFLRNRNMMPALSRMGKAKAVAGAGLAGSAIGGGEVAYQASEQDRLDQLNSLYRLRSQ